MACAKQPHYRRVRVCVLGCKEWGKDASQRVVFSTDADILKRNKGDWGAGAEVREIPPAMRWWLARGVNVVG